MRLELWILRLKVYSSLEGILEMDLSEHLAPKCARNPPLSQKAHLQHFAEIRQTFNKAPWDLLIFEFLGRLEYRRVFPTTSFFTLNFWAANLLTNLTPPLRPSLEKGSSELAVDMNAKCWDCVFVCMFVVRIYFVPAPKHHQLAVTRGQSMANCSHWTSMMQIDEMIPMMVSLSEKHPANGPCNRTWHPNTGSIWMSQRLSHLKWKILMLEARTCPLFP